MSLPLYCYICNDPFDDTGPPWATTYIWPDPDKADYMVATIAEEDVPWSGSAWLEFDFTGVTEEHRWMDPDYGKGIWMCVTTMAPGQYPPDAAGAPIYYRYIYHEKMDWSQYVSFMYYNTNEAAWKRHDPDANAPYELVGITKAGRGYAIYAVGADVPTPRTQYEGMALVVTHADGTRTVFKITDYDYQAPDEWVPNQSYSLPDTWQAHVGDVAHGDWVTPDKRRIFVTEDPQGIVQIDDTMEIMDALLVVGRGINGTEASSHGETTVSLYYEDSVAVDDFEFFSSDIDLRIIDMIKAIAIKAGVFDVTHKIDLEGPQTFTSSARYQLAEKHRNAILKMTIPTMAATDEVGVLFRANVATAPTTGYSVMLTGGSIPCLNFRSLSGSSWTLEESYPVPFSPGGEMTLSCQEHVHASEEDVVQTSYACWIGDRYVHAFTTDGYMTGDYAGPYVITSGSLAVDFELSALDKRIDNYILDMGSRGSQLVSNMIGPKHIIIRDTAEGGIYGDRMRHGEDADYTLPYNQISIARTQSDTDLKTLIRSEGITVVEQLDDELIAEEGLLFDMVNAFEANDEWETANEANYVLQDSQMSLETYSVRAPADMRIQPNDVIELPLVDGTMRMVVGSVSYQLQLDDGDAAFDMSLECYGVQEIEIAGVTAYNVGPFLLAASGEIPITGSLSKTLSASTLSSASSMPISGALDDVLADDILSGSGKVDIDGDLDDDVAAAELAATGTVETV